jgi:hypothetical protein
MLTNRGGNKKSKEQKIFFGKFLSQTRQKKFLQRRLKFKVERKKEG